MKSKYESLSVTGGCHSGYLERKQAEDRRDEEEKARQQTEWVVPAVLLLVTVLLLINHFWINP